MVEIKSYCVIIISHNTVYQLTSNVGTGGEEGGVVAANTEASMDTYAPAFIEAKEYCCILYREVYYNKPPLSST